MTHSFTRGVQVDTDPLLASNSNDVTPSQAAVVAYVTSKIGSGQVIGVTVLTVGSGTFTTSATTRALLVEVLGAGGQGGGVTSAASQSAGGTGGGGGSYARKLFTVTPSTGYSYTVGAGGSTSAAGNNTGQAGASSTFGPVSAVTVTAPGGSGGAGMATGTSVNMLISSAGGTTPTNGDLNVVGQPSIGGMRLALDECAGGNGGNSYFGGGGVGLDSNSDGAAGVGYGAGGAGASSVSTTTSRKGGLGADGVIYITEYS